MREGGRIGAFMKRDALGMVLGFTILGLVMAALIALIWRDARKYDCEYSGGQRVEGRCVMP